MAQLITTLKWTGLIGAVLLSADCDRSAVPVKDAERLPSDVPQAQAKSNEQMGAAVEGLDAVRAKVTRHL